MEYDPRAYLWDVREAAESILEFSRSHAPALIVIHKCWKPVISAWMPKSSVHGWQTLAYYIAQMKHLYKLQVTVHGLDTGIHAGMTAFLARQDLCITASAPAWEPEQ